jgi:hypothetical protein
VTEAEDEEEGLLLDELLCMESNDCCGLSWASEFCLALSGASESCLALPCTSEFCLALD